MRRLYILSLLLLSSQFCTAVADTKSDFREAYQRYQQAISIADTTAALKAAEQSYKLGSKLYGKNHINAAKLGVNYAALLNDKEEYKKAKKVLKGKLAIMESQFDDNAIDMIAPLIELARAEFKPNKPEKSLAYFERVGSIISHQNYPVFRANKNVEIATMLMHLGGQEHARAYYEAAHRDYLTALQPEDARLGRSSFQMAMLAIQEREFEDAADYLGAALVSFDQDGQMNDAERSTRELMVDVLSRTQRHDEANPHLQALGEFDDGPSTPLFRVPLGLDRDQFRKVIGKSIEITFTVDANGFVVDPQIVDSNSDTLNDKALAAIAKFRYAPRFEDGKPVATTNVRHTFDYSKEKVRQMIGRGR